MKTHSLLITAAAPALTLLPALVFAHSGDVDHPGFWATLPHVLTEPDHLLGIVAGSVITLALIVLLKKIQRRIQSRRQQRRSFAVIPEKAASIVCDHCRERGNP